MDMEPVFVNDTGHDLLNLSMTARAGDTRSILFLQQRNFLCRLRIILSFEPMDCRLELRGSEQARLKELVVAFFCAMSMVYQQVERRRVLFSYTLAHLVACY